MSVNHALATGESPTSDDCSQCDGWGMLRQHAIDSMDDHDAPFNGIVCPACGGDGKATR